MCILTLPVSDYTCKLARPIKAMKGNKSLLVISDIVSVMRSGIRYAAPNDMEHSLNFKNFSLIKLVAGVTYKQ